MSTNPILANPVLKATLQAQMAAQNAPPPMPATLPGPSAASQAPPQIGAQAQAPAKPDTGPILPQTGHPSVVYGDQTPVSGVPPVLPSPAQASVRSEHARLLDQGSGISQIAGKVEGAMPNHPLLAKIIGGGLQGLATVGDIGLSAVAPAVAINTPGTEYHHQMLVNRSAREDAEAAGNAEKAAQTQETQARTGLTEAETDKAKQPPKEEWAQLSGFTGPNGEPIEYEKNSGQARIAQGVPGATLIPKEPQEGERPLGQSVDNLNKTLQDRYQVLNPGKPLPPQYKLPANATQKDYDRIDKALGGVEGAEGTLEQRKQTEALRRQALADSEARRQDATGKQDITQRQTIYKTYQPVMDSAERFNVMTKNYEDAIKDHNQQAMLSLLYNHMGMTMGLQKGARMTQDLIREAQQSQPWLQGIKAKFDKDGVLTGVTLSPGQMQQMVGLAQDRYKEDVGKARNEAGYLGASDDGPKRTPGKSTINYYTHLANGDPAKAKQLAADDGWSVQ
jgi:hypothetical protein